ncbi:hypothetical protein GCM10023195_18690 [Actinoallomurus liliacearum]|uniref:Uncharacterized protein n=1 Tax=Actinoallomurus liliacearum TaxID=1080073 RepID=A0ABP8TDI1_9ACTN
MTASAMVAEFDDVAGWTAARLFGLLVVSADGGRIPLRAESVDAACWSTRPDVRPGGHPSNPRVEDR